MCQTQRSCLDKEMDLGHLSLTHEPWIWQPLEVNEKCPTKTPDSWESSLDDSKDVHRTNLWKTFDVFII